MTSRKSLLLLLLILPLYYYFFFVEELEQQAGVFKRNAGELKNRMWWKNIKVNEMMHSLEL